MEFVAHRAPPERSEIQAYRPGGFTISGIRHQGSLIVTTTEVQSIGIGRIEELELAHLEALFAADIDLIVLGTGAEFVLPPAALLKELRGRGIAVDFMTTPAACRTFNLLAAEERRVAAVLIAVTA